MKQTFSLPYNRNKSNLIFAPGSMLKTYILEKEKVGDGTTEYRVTDFL